MVLVILILGYFIAMGGYLRSPPVIIIGSIGIVGFMIWIQRDSPKEGLLRATPVLALAYLIALAQSLDSALLVWFWVVMVVGLVGWVYRRKIRHIVVDVL